MAWRYGIAIYFAFLGLVGLATYPLVLHLASLWPPHHDARVFTWVMASTARRLVEAPLAFSHGNAFYPHGNSLSFSEPLIPPAVLGLPGFLWLGNPILTYNLLLLALWPLAGLTMMWAAFRLTGDWAAAYLAGFIFCLGPYHTEYYLEFQMLMTFPIPLAVVGWVRFLEERDGRWLAWTLAWFAVQTLTSWYYGIILGTYLVGIGLCFCLLRWREWAWRTVGVLAAGAITLAMVLGPLATLYWITHKELGFERTSQEIARHSADLASLVEPGRRSFVYRFAPTRHTTETSLFVGFTALALSTASLSWLRGSAPERGIRLATRTVGTAIGVTLLGLAIFLVNGKTVLHAGPLTLRLTRPGRLFTQLLILSGIGLAMQGWRAASLRAPRRLTEREWVACLLVLGVGFYTLALGPVIHYMREEVGPGPYLRFFTLLPPLKAIRVATRFGVMVVFSTALLAALGLKALRKALAPGEWPWRGLVAAVFCALALEYAVIPARYETVAGTPRPVDRLIKEDPSDVAVLEWPLDVRRADADAMVWSLWHGKRLVNGLSGFVPELNRQLSFALSRPANPFPSEEALSVLRSIHPLRYLVVRNSWLSIEDQERWQRLRLRHGFRWLGREGQDDLYRLELEDRGARINKLLSYDYLRTKREVRLRFRPVGPPAPARQWLEVGLNGRVLQALEIKKGWSDARVELTPPYNLAAANRLTLIHRYRRTPSQNPRYQIGRTGVESLVDIHVVSGGQHYGWVSQIVINGVDYSPNRRGYNLVTLSPPGDLLGSAAFDTFHSSEESGRLARFLGSLPNGTIVIASVKDEAAAQLTEEAVFALRSVGGIQDLRRQLWISHLLIGVKGAPAGSAIEAVGARLLTATLGEAPQSLGIELAELAFR